MQFNKLLIQSFCGVLFSFALAFAHPSGVSVLDIHIEKDSLLMGVVVKGPDVLYALNTNSTLSRSPEEIIALNDQIAAYMQNRIALKIDNNHLSGMSVRSWTKENKSPTNRLDSAQLNDTTYQFALVWPLPLKHQRLEINVRMFAEFEMQVVSQVSIYWQNQVVQRKWLGLDDNLLINIMPDSLLARLATEKNQTPTEKNTESKSVFLRFVGLGFKHIIPLGIDHILFVLGLFLFSTKLRPLFIQISAFTLAHSITLALAMLGLFSLPARIVEPLIALSIAVVAIENIFFRTLRPWRWILVFCFGLVHGLGFASALKDLGLVKSQFLTILVGFNVGVEVGQLTVISGATLLTIWFWKKRWYFKGIVLPGSIGIAAIGLFWAITRAFGLNFG